MARPATAACPGEHRLHNGQHKHGFRKPTTRQGHRRKDKIEGASGRSVFAPVPSLRTPRRLSRCIGQPCAGQCHARQRDRHGEGEPDTKHQPQPRTPNAGRKGEQGTPRTGIRTHCQNEHTLRRHAGYRCFGPADWHFDLHGPHAKAQSPAVKEDERIARELLYQHHTRVSHAVDGYSRPKSGHIARQERAGRHAREDKNHRKTRNKPADTHQSAARHIENEVGRGRTCMAKRQHRGTNCHEHRELPRICTHARSGIYGRPLRRSADGFRARLCE